MRRSARDGGGRGGEPDGPDDAGDDLEQLLAESREAALANVGSAAYEVEPDHGPPTLVCTTMKDVVT